MIQVICNATTNQIEKIEVLDAPAIKQALPYPPSTNEVLDDLIDILIATVVITNV